LISRNSSGGAERFGGPLLYDSRAAYDKGAGPLLWSLQLQELARSAAHRGISHGDAYTLIWLDQLIGLRNG